MKKSTWSYFRSAPQFCAFFRGAPVSCGTQETWVFVIPWTTSEMCSLCSQLGSPTENSQRPQVHGRPSQRRFYRTVVLIVSQSLEVLKIFTSHFTLRDFTGHIHISSQAHLILLAWHSLSHLLFFRSKFPVLHPGL